ncbi:hypothetical protein HDV02_000516 [Globomyces sp. JEL0801]|nr:hypothetical protein HDV02_000516 [Globomyces sp. JEL0801]
MSQVLKVPVDSIGRYTSFFELGVDDKDQHNRIRALPSMIFKKSTLTQMASLQDQTRIVEFISSNQICLSQPNETEIQDSNESSLPLIWIFLPDLDVDKFTLERLNLAKASALGGGGLGSAYEKDNGFDSKDFLGSIVRTDEPAFMTSNDLNRTGSKNTIRSTHRLSETPASFNSQQQFSPPSGIVYFSYDIFNVMISTVASIVQLYSLLKEMAESGVSKDTNEVPSRNLGTDISHSSHMDHSQKQPRVTVTKKAPTKPKSVFGALIESSVVRSVSFCCFLIPTFVLILVDPSAPFLQYSFLIEIALVSVLTFYEKSLLRFLMNPFKPRHSAI